MQKSGFIAIALICGFCSGASASPLFGPKGEFSSLFSSLEWKPGRACYKPMRPFSGDKYAWESYKNDAIAYLDCMKRAANSDAKYAVEVVNDGYQKAADDFLREVKTGY